MEERNFEPSVLGGIQRNRQKDAAGLIDDLQVPATPVDILGIGLFAQFLNGLERLIMRRIQISDIDPRLVQDPFVRMHKMEVTMHSKTALEPS